MKITLTDADYVAALYKRTWDAAKEWERIKADAREAAAERLLDANQARTRELLAQKICASRDFNAWKKRHDEISRLFDEHDKLLVIAYPRAREKVEK